MKNKIIAVLITFALFAGMFIAGYTIGKNHVIYTQVISTIDYDDNDDRVQGYYSEIDGDVHKYYAG